MNSALIFGGSGGIGSAISRRVAQRQPTTITYAARSEPAQQLAVDLAAGPYDARALHVNATSSSEVVAAFDAAEELGQVSAVVNCVGGWGFPRLSDVTDEEIDGSLDLNLRSALFILREAARRVTDGGRIVMLSSVAVGVAPARQATYVAAKAGVEGAARVAAKELARRGVTVNVIRPGSTDTETLHRTTADKAIQAMSTANAFRRLGTPEDVAGAVDLLLSPDAGWLTGQVIEATGGLR